MPWSVSDDPVQPEEAIRFFRNQVGIRKAEWKKLAERARQQAFTVAGVAELDVIHDVWSALDKAISDGSPFEDFVAQVSDKLEAAWMGTVANPGARIDTIFRTNTQRAYAAGRFEQATDPDVLEDRPYWLIDATLDARTSEICRKLHGTLRPADDPWWESHQPPFHFNCRSQIITLTEEQAQKLGGVTRAPKTRAQEGFGKSPADIWTPDASKYPRELWDIYQEKLAI